ncbi:hypothetical protein LSH36_25g05013 [Paralvinella palmiformis]|uniref:Uncharacterized protein n=1 Tax=Paralvinella palmiformis TaxID=53620 RepID=A0AAD9KAU4_9ANNE|nr:hypothetical protein LSH36_25g05013 [Paralvinella palmiformis]
MGVRGKEKVITSDTTEAFQFNKWRDLTRDIKALFRLPVIRIFIFRDENTKEKYMRQYVAFREKCRTRDEFMEHEEVFSIPGYRDRLLLCSDIQRRPFWLRESVFWVFTFLLLTWPYRIFVSRRSTQVYVVFIKELDG